jgi:hypothetical protein
MNRVFVTGAGASKHAGGPLMADFLEEGLYHLCAGSLYRIDHRRFWMVVDLLDELFSLGLRREVEGAIEHNEINVVHVDRLYGISIEAILSHVESRAFSERTDELRGALHFFIYQTLQQLTTHSASWSRNDDGTLNHKRNCYHRLVDYGLQLTDANCFITFNYDLLLDEALAINNHQLVGDYCMPFSSIGHFSSYDRILKGQRKPIDVDLLKLHGSLNWMVCQSCERHHLTFYIDYAQIPSESCPECGNRLSPCLVAPTVPKNPNQGSYRLIWDVARERLIHADEITVIGYSFPSGDLEALSLFKATVASRRQKPSLVVVDPSATVRQHIQGAISVVASEQYETFEDYCEKKNLSDAR